MCGALKRARLVHPGVAEVVFVKKEDAITAYKKYNNRCLDGKFEARVAFMIDKSPKIFSTSAESLKASEMPVCYQKRGMPENQFKS